MGSSESCFKFNQTGEKQNVHPKRAYQPLNADGKTVPYSDAHSSPTVHVHSTNGTQQSDLPFMDTTNVSPDRAQQRAERRQEIANRHKKGALAEATDYKSASPHSAVHRLRRQVDERGERLLKTEDAAAQLNNTASQFEDDTLRFARKYRK